MATADEIEALSLLGEPVRRRLYEYISRRLDPVGRDEAAEAVGIKRSLAAFHLDKLAEEGLLDVEFRRPSDRRGPGAGRPAKLYRRSARDIGVSLPHREYELAARLFAEALDDHDAGVERLHRAARAFGRSLAEEIRRRAGRRTGQKNLTHLVEETLEDYGFQPYHDSEGNIRLGSCPFHSLSRDHTSLVCGTNLDIMRSILDELGLERLDAGLEPRSGMCCVAFRRL